MLPAGAADSKNPPSFTFQWPRLQSEAQLDGKGWAAAQVSFKQKRHRAATEPVYYVSGMWVCFEDAGDSFVMVTAPTEQQMLK